MPAPNDEGIPIIEGNPQLINEQQINPPVQILPQGRLADGRLVLGPNCHLEIKNSRGFKFNDRSGILRDVTKVLSMPASDAVVELEGYQEIWEDDATSVIRYWQVPWSARKVSRWTVARLLRHPAGRQRQPGHAQYVGRPGQHHPDTDADPHGAGLPSRVSLALCLGSSPGQQ